MKRQSLFYIFIIVAIVAFDRITKLWALSVCTLKPLVINEYLSFFVAYNRGMAWSLAASNNDIIFSMVTALAVCVTIIVGYAAYNRYVQGHIIVGECMVIAGSLGNLYDRSIFGAVVDFIECCYGNWCWPVFNVADVAVVIGVGVMVYCYKRNEYEFF